jgi:hypothetical protein
MGGASHPDAPPGSVSGTLGLGALGSGTLGPPVDPAPDRLLGVAVEQTFVHA